VLGEQRAFYFELVNSGASDYLELREIGGLLNPASRRWEQERSKHPAAAAAESKQIPVSLRAEVGRRDLGSSGEFLMWADLHIRNESDYPITDVGVNVELVRNAFTINGEYVWSPAVKWNPTSLVWSTRHAPENTLLLTIPAHEERTVTVAYCNDSNGNGGYFCVPNFAEGNNVRLHSDVNQVNVSVSSLAGGLPRREAFYLQGHPNYLRTVDGIAYREDSKFEFRRWDDFASETGFKVQDS
jgi:hypothetical protein